ncbi:MAG: ribonuclease III [Alphaproteobacteria bacterium]|nr:ribonuclease III [Alphaproteobacteria bacterium]
MDTKDLEERLGYQFSNKKLLEQALTHSSMTTDIHRNYERLEFLGDRILGVTIADMLCNTFKNEPEGALAQRFVCLVCKDMVAEIMKGLGVSDFIKTVNPSVKYKATVLCDVGEALIAAIYLDSGAIETAQDFVKRHWTAHIDKKSRPKKDYKTMLQEKTAAKKLPAPLYRMLKKTGPEHEPVFSVQVTVGDKFEAVGSSGTIRHAEQDAAEKMLIEMGVIDG